jgi:hypothetical protein
MANQARAVRLNSSLARTGTPVGAWLGSTPPPGSSALVTAIARAAAGRNLMIIVVDVTWHRWIGIRSPTGAEATSASKSRAVVAA